MRPFFIGLSVALGFSINPILLAQNAGPQMQNMIHSFSLKKSDVLALIKNLLHNGKITETQARDAIKRLDTLSENEIKSLTMKALSNIHTGKEIFADGDKENASETSVKRGPASLPVSPFVDTSQFEYNLDQEKERKRREKIQKELLKNAFDIKKFQ